MKGYNPNLSKREFRKLLLANGFEFSRIGGKHEIWIFGLQEFILPTGRRDVSPGTYFEMKRMVKRVGMSLRDHKAGK